MLKHSKISNTPDDPTADIKPSDWNDGHVVDQDGVDFPTRTDIPSSPDTGKVKVFSRGQSMLSVMDEYSNAEVQLFFGSKKVGYWTALGNTTNGGMQAVGLIAPSILGTATTRNVAATNMLTSARRMAYVSATAAGSRAGAYTGFGQFLRGSVPGVGGFRVVMRFGCSDAATVAGARTFVGMSPTSVLASDDPTTLVNVVGVCTDSTDSNFSIIHNDGSGVGTKIDLGANFPDHTLSEDLYELMLYCTPNSSTMDYRFTRLNTGHVASGTISSNLPVATTLLYPAFVRGNGATALSVGIDVVSLYVETNV